jgi:hypothetical protein
MSLELFCFFVYAPSLIGFVFVSVFSLSRSEELLSTTTSCGFAGRLVFVFCVRFGLLDGCAVCLSFGEVWSRPNLAES